MIINYDKNGTAIRTLAGGQGATSVSVIAVVPYNFVIVSWAVPSAVDTDYRTLALYKGQTAENCATKVTLKDISFSEATFEFKRKNGDCPICIVQGILMRMPEPYEPVLSNSSSFG